MPAGGQVGLAGPVVPQLTDDFTDLVVHVLAHVRLREAGSLFDAKYGAWVAEQMPPAERTRLREGAAALERAWARGAPPLVHAWPEVFGSLDELRAVGGEELSTLDPAQVRAPAVLEAVRSAPGVERLHAVCGALAPWFGPWRREALAPAQARGRAEVGRWLEEAVELQPGLGAARVELAFALGGRGRAFRRRIVVGMPAAWNELDGRTPAVLAMHEHAVLTSGHAGYVEAEWAALTRLAATMQRASELLRRAHGRWSASLGLGPLLDALVRAGRLTPEQRSALHEAGHDRAERLAALAEPVSATA